MSESSQDDTRTISDDGTQQESEQLTGGGRSSYGPPISSGGDQEPGGVVPPYEGRRESADIDEGGTHRDGANVGGATHPRTSDGKSDQAAFDAQGGRQWSPSDETPAGDGSGRPQEDPGQGPDHYPGTGRGEDKA